MKKLLLLALLLMPTMTLARESIDLPAQAITEPIYAPIVEPSPTPAPSEGSVSVGGGGMNPAMFMPTISREAFLAPWFGEGIYQFTSTQFGFAYFERPDGTRIYEMDYATGHTIQTDGKGTIYFVQVDANKTWDAIKVLEIE